MICLLYDNIYFKKFLAIFLIVLICFFMFLPAPPAEAIILDTVTAVAISIVVSTALVAIGVSATTDHAAFDVLVEDVGKHLIDTGVCSAQISLAVINQVAYVPVRIVNAIKDYLFDSGVVYQGESTFNCSYDSPVGSAATPTYYTNYLGKMSYNSDKRIPAVDFFNSLPAKYANVLNANISNVDLSQVTWAWAYVYEPSFVMVGVSTYAGDLIICNNVTNTNFGGCSANDPRVFAYRYNQFNSYIGNVWRIYNGSAQVSSQYCFPVAACETYANFGMQGYPEVYYNYGELDAGSICSDEALDINQSLKDNVGIDELYPSWSVNEQTYTQENEDVIGLPLTVPDSYSDVYGLTQEQAWAGDIATSLQGVDTNVGTIADAIPDILTNTGSIATSVSDVLTQVTSLVDFFTGTVVVANPFDAINFGNLFSLFPFNIPFELINALTSLSAEPAAPDIVIPLPNYDNGFCIYTYTKNISDIPNVPLAATLIRSAWMLFFSIGLFKITSKVIKW